MSNFKSSHSFESRKKESTKILEKYRDRVPVIVERIGTSIPDIDKKKFLVPRDLTVAQFLFVIRKRIKLTPEKAIFIFIKDILPPISEHMSAIYEKYKDEDGFVYVSMSGEQCFGGN